MDAFYKITRGYEITLHVHVRKTQGMQVDILCSKLTILTTMHSEFLKKDPSIPPQMSPAVMGLPENHLIWMLRTSLES